MLERLAMNHSHAIRALALLALAGLAMNARADVAVPQGGTLDLAVGPVNTRTLADLLPGEGAFTDPAYVIVLRQPMSQAVRDALNAAGVRTLGYLPVQAFLADLRGTTSARLRGAGVTASVHAWENGWKVSPELLAQAPAFATPERAALAARGEVAATLTLFPGAAAADFAASLAEIPGSAFLDSELVGESLVVQVSLPSQHVARLGGIPELMFAEPAPEFTERSTLATRWVVTTNQQDNFALYDAGLTGVGQIVGVVDSAPDINHCGLADTNPIGPTHRKIHAYNFNTSSYAFHGTHTSGILLSNAIGGDTGPEVPPPGASPDLQGVAYGARMVYNTYPAFGEANVYARFELHRTQGAFVHSNSWGNDNTRNYDSTCRAIDNFMWTNQDQLLLFSTSNSSLIRNPENAKNLIGVGSSGNAPVQDQACGGGEGPSLDGRIKPDVVAPGCQINAASAGSGCGTVPSTGTSMACPAAAGVATLIRQYFTQGWYPTGAPTPSDAMVPSGALLKAMVVNSAVDVTGWPGYPGTRDGWGRVLADNVLFLANRTPAESRKLAVWDIWNCTERALSTDQSRTFRVNVQSSTEPLGVTLAWTDPPATAGVASPEVNNLNLVITAPDNTVYRGNVLANGVSIPGGAADTENNVEQFILPGPQTGLWTISVSGASVNEGVQGFAVVATGALVAIGCNDVDFNNDGSLFDPLDVDAFFSVFSEGPCIPETQVCDSIDFNNDGSLFDPLDVEAFLRVFSEGPCE
jgi:hypothetical protein